MEEINVYADEMIRVYGLTVYNALHNSKLRGDVLIFFKRNPVYMTISHVSKSMHVDYSNIKRVINGKGGNYTKNRALVRLRLLTREESDGGEVYIINIEGFKAAELLEKERESELSDQ